MIYTKIQPGGPKHRRRVQSTKKGKNKNTTNLDNHQNTDETNTVKAGQPQNQEKEEKTKEDFLQQEAKRLQITITRILTCPRCYHHTVHLIQGQQELTYHCENCGQLNIEETVSLKDISIQLLQMTNPFNQTRTGTPKTTTQKTITKRTLHTKHDPLQNLIAGRVTHTQNQANRQVERQTPVQYQIHPQARSENNEIESIKQSIKDIEHRMRNMTKGFEQQIKNTDKNVNMIVEEVNTIKTQTSKGFDKLSDELQGKWEARAEKQDKDNYDNFVKQEEQSKENFDVISNNFKVMMDMLTKKQNDDQTRKEQTNEMQLIIVKTNIQNDEEKNNKQDERENSRGHSRSNLDQRVGGLRHGMIGNRRMTNEEMKNNAELNQERAQSYADITKNETKTWGQFPKKTSNTRRSPRNAKFTTRYFIIERAGPISQLRQALIQELGGDGELVKAYNTHGNREDCVVEIACIETKAEKLVKGMEKQSIEAKSVPPNYDPLRPLDYENIKGEEKNEKVKQHLELVEKQWTNSATKPLNEATRAHFRSKIEAVQADKALLTDCLLTTLEEGNNVLTTPRGEKNVRNMTVDNEHEDQYMHMVTENNTQRNQPSSHLDSSSPPLETEAELETGKKHHKQTDENPNQISLE